MNDTPRTNAILTSILDTSGHVGFINCPPAWVAWARELERELNAANAHIKRLEEAYFASEALHTVRDCACCDSPDVWTRCSTCCDKIKRYHAANFNLNRTEEAKEDKP